MASVQELCKDLNHLAGWLGSEWSKPTRLFCCLGSATPMKRIHGVFHLTVVLLTLIGLLLSVPSWGADPASSTLAKEWKIVAAGLGYQDAETSSITVKTYKADSGEVLSADTYELDIKEEGPPSSHPRARIFAGGVGINANGLSEFTLRVYDAANGRFLWEGRLNLIASPNADVAAYPVVAEVRPRAPVMKLSGRSTASGQPYFVLRAIDPATGQLIWTDKFSANQGTPSIEWMSRSIIGMEGSAPPHIDFRIKMPDEGGLTLLWEDRVLSSEDGEVDALDQSESSSGMLPPTAPQGHGEHKHGI